MITVVTVLHKISYNKFKSKNNLVYMKSFLAIDTLANKSKWCALVRTCFEEGEGWHFKKGVVFQGERPEKEGMAEKDLEKSSGDWYQEDRFKEGGCS